MNKTVLFQIIIIDDNSPDGTLEIAMKLQNVYGSDKIVVSPRPGKLGKIFKEDFCNSPQFLRSWSCLLCWRLCRKFTVTCISELK